jgi:hypothetical protein
VAEAIWGAVNRGFSTWRYHVKRSLISLIASLALAAAILVVPGAGPAAAAGGNCARTQRGWAYLVTGYGPVAMCVEFGGWEGRAGYVSLATGKFAPLTGWQSFRVPNHDTCCDQDQLVKASDGVRAYVAESWFPLSTAFGRMIWGIQYRTRFSGSRAIPEGRFGAVDARDIFHPTSGWLPLRWTTRDPFPLR